MWAAAFDTVSFNEAVEWFARRTPFTDAEFARNAEQARRQAFWIAGVTQADVIKDVHESLKKALADGVPFEQWKAEVGPKLSKAWLGSGINEPARTETIFRNWAQNSYNRARWNQMHEPSVLRFRPYLMFDGVEDSRQSPICQACNGTLLPAGHPWWDAHRPPLHHRCRSGIRSLRTEQAKARGITQSPTDIGPQEGFGDGGEWQGPNRAKYIKGAKPPPKPATVKPPERLRRAAPVEATPIKGRPPETFRLGVHAHTMPLKGTTQEHALAITAGLTQDDLKVLQRRPLATLTFTEELKHRGRAVNGLYYTGAERLSVMSKRGAHTFGQAFKPGESWSISSAATTPLEASRRTLIHELGHHLHGTLGREGDAVVQQAWRRSSTVITQYGRTNRAEYFAESFAAYRYHPAELLAHDPNGHAMVVDVLRLHGIDP